MELPFSLKQASVWVDRAHRCVAALLGEAGRAGRPGRWHGARQCALSLISCPLSPRPSHPRIPAWPAATHSPVSLSPITTLGVSYDASV